MVPNAALIHAMQLIVKEYSVDIALIVDSNAYVYLVGCAVRTSIEIGDINRLRCRLIMFSSSKFLPSFLVKSSNRIFDI